LDGKARLRRAHHVAPAASARKKKDPSTSMWRGPSYNLHLRDIVHLINTMREGSFRALTGCL
jgi:hypothetical protein